MTCEIRKISPNSWYQDTDGAHHPVYEETLATADTWRELMAKENDWWYAGKGGDIFRDGEKIGSTSDLIIAQANRQECLSGRQLPVRLRDLIEAAADNE